jgi:YHS domain-containing protein
MTVATPKRRWYQFSLMTLMLLMTAACLALAYVAYGLQAARLALEGYCPVTLHDEYRWVLGDQAIRATHQGRLYHFTTNEHRQKFSDNPDIYSAAFSGHDVVMFAKSGKLVDGARNFGVEYYSRMYFFSNAETRDEFERSPDTYAKVAKKGRATEKPSTIAVTR